MASPAHLRRSVVRSLLVTGLPATIVFAGPPASAAIIQGFSADFVPTNWSINASDSAFIDVSAAPNELTLKSPDSNSGDPETFTYAIDLPVSNYSLGFQWFYESVDTSPANDLFGYNLNNGGFVNLVDPFGALSQSGYIKITANPGDNYAFAMASTDNIGGRATVQIRSFIAGLPSEVPDCACVPAPLPLLGAAAFFRWARRIRCRVSWKAAAA
jgi:hypothetical protein